jgi:hypothetical protein
VNETVTDDRERRLIDAVVSLAKAFREEGERLGRRLSRLERDFELLAIRLDAQMRAPREASPPGDSPPGPSRTRL